MKTESNTPRPSTSRRDFIRKTSGALAGVSLAGGLASRSYAAEDNTIKLALVGCGGRGTGAIRQAMSTKGPTKLVAMADVFDNRLRSSLKRASRGRKDKVDVPKERQFIGMDAYRKAIDCIAPGGVVLLTTPPAFRPIHLEYAVAKGCHVFMEKSFAVDVPGVRRVLAAGKEADKKNLKIATGLMSRHYAPLEEAVRRIHDGAIGDVVTCWAYRMHGPVGFQPKKPGMKEIAHQIRNYSNFTWVNGSFLLDWLIHNLDVCCWVKDAWPVSAQGQGGRQQREVPDQMYDHFAIEYTYPDGTRLFAQGRHMDGCYGFFGDKIHGSKGLAILGEGVGKPEIYKGHKNVPENLAWTVKRKGRSPYQIEHNLLFDAIRNDKPYNETERSAYACMTGILGRMAAESGKKISWDATMASNLELAPGLEKCTMQSDAPVMPDADGNYPIPTPGLSKVR